MNPDDNRKYVNNGLTPAPLTSRPNYDDNESYQSSNLPASAGKFDPNKDFFDAGYQNDFINRPALDFKATKAQISEFDDDYTHSTLDIPTGSSNPDEAFNETIDEYQNVKELNIEEKTINLDDNFDSDDNSQYLNTQSLAVLPASSRPTYFDDIKKANTANIENIAKEKINFNDVVNIILEKHSGLLLANYKKKEVYLYSYPKGCFSALDKDAFCMFVRDIFRSNTDIEALLTTGFLSNVFAAIYQNSEIQVTSNDFDSQKHLICVKNGVIDVETGNLLSHSPKYQMLRHIPVKYNKNAPLPKRFMKLVERMFDTPENLKFALQVMVYLVSNFGPEIKKMPIFLGSGNCGKTLLANILLRFYNDDEIARYWLRV